MYYECVYVLIFVIPELKTHVVLQNYYYGKVEILYDENLIR